MNNDLKVSEEYKRAFNQGYILSKEVGLSSSSFKDLLVSNDKMQGFYDGMHEYAKEIGLKSKKDKDQFWERKPQSRKKGGGMSF
ncbi:hypothetical protein [Ekhidna sp.]|uniref:hypothetical protein n=1 Tax=Ekhidna sp. TaxID=2608089 RepID=UPI0032981D92